MTAYRAALAATCFTPFACSLWLARRDRKRQIEAARRPIANRYHAHGRVWR